MSVDVSTRVHDDKTILEVAGEVDVSNASELRDAIDAVLATCESAIEVDLGQVPYIDSTGIGVLVGAAHRAADAGLKLVVTNPQRNVMRVLTMLGVNDELGIGA